MRSLRWLLFATGSLVIAAFFLLTWGSGHAGEPPPQLGPFPTGDGDRVQVEP